jgi:hypothetical protein
MARTLTDMTPRELKELVETVVETKLTERFGAASPPKPQPVAAFSFIDTALALDLDGPPDWSENLEEYLYGERI